MNRTWTNMIANIKREKLMSISNIIVMTVTFVMLGMFIFIVAISQTSLRYLENQAQVTAFFKDDFPEQNILNLKAQYEQDERIAEIRYVSKEDAYKIFTEMNKDEPILLESISVNILPASLEVKAKNISDLSSLSEEFANMDGVEEVRFFRDVIERFRFWSTVVYAVGFVLVVAFLVISYSIIIATLRTTINSKGVELEIQKLVGASDSYVKLPLIYQGMLFGLFSAFVAGLLMILFGVLFSSKGWFSTGLAFGFIHGLNVSPMTFSSILAVILVISGVLLGFFGSQTAVRRYLKY